MKKMILLFLLFPYLCLSQELKPDDKTGLYSKQDILILDSIDKDIIFTKTVEWITLNYKSAQDVVQLSDKNSGKIILKGNFITNMYFKEGFIKHTLIIDIKDNKLRYTYNNLSYYSPGSGNIPFEENMMSKKKLIERTDKDMSASMKSLEVYIKKSDSNDSW